MKKRVLILVMTLITAQLYAQSVAFVNISSDPTYYSLGGATLTADANAFSVSGNSSAIVFGEQKISAAASYGIWQPTGVNDGIISLSGYGLLTDKIAVGLSGKYLLHQPYDIIGNDGTILKQYTPQDLSLEVGVAYKVMDGLSAGLNVRYISSNLYEDAQGSAVAADLSLSYRLNGLRLALAATNIGSKIDYGYTPYNLPSMAKFGAGYALNLNEKSTLSFNGECDYLINKGGLMAGLGAEFNYNKMVAARVGFHYGDDNSIPTFASAGLGVKFAGVSLDAAYILGITDSPINGSMMISLGYSF